MQDKNINVTLDPNVKPPVGVDRNVDGQTMMRWVRAPHSPQFEFTDIEFFPPGHHPFSDIDLKRNEIAVANDVSMKGEFEYNITVTYRNTEYDTIKEGPPGGDKPVIRN